MSWEKNLNDNFDELLDASDGHAEVSDSEEASEEGLIPHEASRALVYLLRHGVVRSQDKQQIFQSLCKYEEIIATQLKILFLEMLLDKKNGFAMLKQKEGDNEVDDEEIGSGLIIRYTLSYYDSLVLLMLRKYFKDRENAGEQTVFIDPDQLETMLHPFLSASKSDRMDRKVLHGALKRLKDKKIITQPRGDRERYEILPTIRHVVNVDFLEVMLEEYAVLAEKGKISPQTRKRKEEKNEH